MKKLILIFYSFIFSTCVYAQSLIKQVDSLLLNTQYEKVIELVNSTPQSDEILLNRKCEALILSGKIIAAEELIKKIEETPSKNVITPALLETNKGILSINQGQFGKAIEQLHIALKIFEISNASNTLDAAKTMANLAFAYKSTGKATQAEQQMLITLGIRQNLLPETHELMAATYNDLGFVYSGLDNDKALEYYEMAQAIYIKLHGENHSKNAISLINTGIIYRELELYGDAVNNFESALKIWEKLYPQPHPQKAFSLLNLGETYQAMKDLKAALGYYERAKDMYEKTYGKKHPELAYVYNLIGLVKNVEEKYDEALASYQDALIANIVDFNSSDIAVNPGTSNFYNGNVLLYSLMYKAQALESKYFGKTLKQTELELGLNTLFACDTLIDKLRQQINNESDKISLGAISNEVYADGVRIAYTLGEVAFKKKEYREQAFFFAEKSKSAVLLEAISDANAKSFAKIPAALLEEEKNLKTSLALINQKLSEKPSAEEERYLREAAFSLERDYNSFTKRLEKNYPEYFNLKYNTTSPSIEELQSLLTAKEALISYFIDEKNSRLYTFLITKKGFRILSQFLIEEYDKYITGLRNGITFMNMNAFKRSSRALDKLLIPHIPGNIKDLIIIPTGRMSVIPFETLLTKESKEETYNSLPYLLKKYSVRYEFSTGLVLQKQSNQMNRIGSIMLCAPISFPAKDNLSDLPGTEQEVKSIAQLFEANKISNQVFIADKADEVTIKSDKLSSYNFVHFATHGVVDELNPENSRIFLQASSEAEDGNLFTGEIYNLELNANLVTLSACETGLGKISKGEGVIGLSRALVYAGAKKIIVSFWSVADESTALLMMDFYKHVLEHQEVTYTTNLQRSKLDFLSGQYAAPYYWAPFILIGF